MLGPLPHDLLERRSGDDEVAACLVEVQVGVVADHQPVAIGVDAEPAELIELLGQAGVTPATTVAILRAEDLEATEVAPLLPIVGVPIPDGIRTLHDRWELPLVEAAEALDATATEMRAAGCTPVDIMASRPRDVLRTLPDDPHLWELAAGTMATAGHPASQVASHLVAHAPTVEAFAAGLGTLTDDPATAMSLAADHGAPVDYLVGTSERYGLSPAETATVLIDSRTSTQMVFETLWERCDHDLDATTDVATNHAHISPLDLKRCLRTAGLTDPGADVVSPASIASSVFDIGDADSLLAMLPEAVEHHPARAVESGMARHLPLEERQLTGLQP